MKVIRSLIVYQNHRGCLIYQLTRAYHRHVVQTRNAAYLTLDLFVRAYPECLEHHQIVDQNVQFIKIVQQLWLVLIINVETLVQVLVVLIQSVQCKIIDQYVGAFKDLKVIHFHHATLFKVSFFLFLLF